MYLIDSSTSIYLMILLSAPDYLAYDEMHIGFVGQREDIMSMCIRYWPWIFSSHVNID